MEGYSEEVDSRSCGAGSEKKRGGGGGGDGATIEMVKRRRGRPLGSKNRPKPPVIITRESPAETSPSLRPHVLEVPPGLDVAAALAAFSRRRGLGLCVLAAAGSVAGLSLRRPPDDSSAAGLATFRGRLEILSMSATFLPPVIASGSGGGPAEGRVSVTVAGPQGSVVGGTVAGPLVAAGTVTVVAAAFAGTTFHRLPAEEPPAAADGGDAPAAAAAIDPHNDGGDPNDDYDQEEEAEHHHHHYHQHYHDDHPHHHHHHGSSSTDGASMTMSLYGGHFPPDVLWTPAARSPNPPTY